MTGSYFSSDRCSDFRPMVSRFGMLRKFAPSTENCPPGPRRTASFTVTAGAESEVGAVLAKAKVSISASLTTSNSSSLSNSVTLQAGAGQYAHGQYVSWGQSVSYRKYRTNYNCSTTTLATGTIKFPSTSEGWYTWVDTKPYV